MTRLVWIEHGSAEYDAEVALRDAVLRRPLGLAFTPEQLAAEAGSLHLLAQEGEDLLGCLVLTPREGLTIQMRQVAVDPRVQGRGIGGLLVAEAERKARELGFKRMILHARDTAISFYERLGYAPEGAPFTEIGIPHRAMEKALA